MKKDKHPDRDELLKAIESQTNRFSGHLAECEECRDLYDLLSRHGITVGPVTEEPSTAAVDCWAAIARIESSRKPRRSVAGQLAYDSWTQRPVMQVRDGGSALERRVRFQAGKYTIEIVGDRGSAGWDFSARVYIGKTVT
ncbi:MAG: hypothetical protein KKA42_07710, partial [candidate division Zixibacteria bacterium]|nr:hypothetical protein [candidate division Zixibacteria bacterium]